MLLTSRRRQGFTLVELIVTMVIMGAVMGSIMTVLVRQQRFYRSANDIMEARTQVRQATDMLPADLRTLSSSDVRNGTDFYTATDKTLDFRTVSGSSILCKSLSSTSIVLPPADLAGETMLSAWSTPPQTGDSLLIYDDSTATGNADDHWTIYYVAGVGTLVATSANACGTSTGYVSAADVAAGRVSYKLTLDNNLSATISTGAPIRIFHRRRYELYQPSVGSGWYLGTYECRASCGTLSPVSGPFATYSATPGNTGLRFTYLDSLGNALTPTTTTERAKIWRIVLTARADTHAPVDIPGKTLATVRDSLSLDVALRNRK